MGIKMINSLLLIDAQEFVTSAGENNNVSLDSTMLRVSTTNNNDSITGFVPTFADAGGLILLLNASPTNNLVLKHNDSSSTADFRIYNPESIDLTIPPYEDTILRYVEVSGRTGWWTFAEARAAITAKVTRSSDHNINNATPTIIGWNSEEFDTASMHDNVTNNSRITIPVTGQYHLGATLKLSGNSAKVVVEIFKNGSLAAVMSDLLMDSGGEPTVTVDGVWQLTAGDYVEVRMTQNSGSAKNLTVGSVFWAYKI